MSVISFATPLALAAGGGAVLGVTAFAGGKKSDTKDTTIRGGALAVATTVGGGVAVAHNAARAGVSASTASIGRGAALGALLGLSTLGTGLAISAIRD